MLVDDGFNDGQRICSVCGGRESLPHTANHCFSGGIAVGQLDTANTKAQLARVVGALEKIRAIVADRVYDNADEESLMRIDDECVLTMKEISNGQ